MPNKNNNRFWTEWYQAVPELICFPYLRAWVFDLFLSCPDIRKSPHILRFILSMLHFCSTLSLFNCSVWHSFTFLFQTNIPQPPFSRLTSPHARLSGQDIKLDCVYVRGWMFRSVCLVFLFTVIMDMLHVVHLMCLPLGGMWFISYIDYTKIPVEFSSIKFN